MEIYNFGHHIQNQFEFKPSENLSQEENIRLSKLGIIIINVKQSTERREKILQWVETLGITTCVFNAVEGNLLKIHDTSFNPLVKVIEYNNNYFLLDYTRHFDHEVRGELGSGMVGASLSHILLYHLLQYQPYCENFLILEDDASLIQDVTTLRKYLANLPNTFDMAFLNSESKWYPIERTDVINEYYSNIKRQFLNASVSYVISKQGAAKLLAYSRHDVTRPPDDLISNPHVLGIYTVIASNEFLFGCDYSFESDAEKLSKKDLS